MWGDCKIEENLFTEKKGVYQQILPVLLSLKESQKNDVSAQKVTVLHPGDVISSQSLIERGILDYLPEVGYGENLCNQGKKDPVYKLPHVKRNVFLKWGDPSLVDSKNYITYFALNNIYKEDEGLRIFTCYLECFIEKEHQAQKVGHIQLRFGE